MTSKTSKTFKDHLDEKYINSRLKEWEAAILGFVPLSTWILSDYEVDVPKAFRVASLGSLKSLFKYQHQKKQIPTFTVGSKGIAGGAIMIPEVLVELKGKTVLEFDKDATTRVDRNGNRWINVEHLLSSRNKFVLPILKEIDKYMKKHHSEYYKDYNWEENPFINSYKNFEVFDKELTGKDKNKFLKWYYKTAKKMMTDKIIHEIKKEILNKWDGSDFTNDEILLHDYEVTAWWFYEDKDYDRFGMNIMDKDNLNKFMDSNTQTYKEYVDNYLFDEFIQWKSDLGKKYPGLCTNYVTKNDVVKINISVNKYPKCKR
jgi:hypothetical protein